MIPHLHIYKTPEILAGELADQLINWIIDHEEGAFHLAVSGGKTPDMLFIALAQKYAASSQWQKVHFWWVDERMVSPDHPESNFGNARRLLFSKIQVPEKNIHRIKGENDPQTEALSYSQQILENLPQQNGWPKFDLILLGMGDDGHTASIFPDQLHLINSPEICEVALHPQNGQKRVTLTGQVINHSKKVCFIVTGASKAERLSEIWENKENAKLLPAAHIHPSKGKLYWYVDQLAIKTCDAPIRG